MSNRIRDKAWRGVPIQENNRHSKHKDLCKVFFFYITVFFLFVHWDHLEWQYPVVKLVTVICTSTSFGKPITFMLSSQNPLRCSTFLCFYLFCRLYFVWTRLKHPVLVLLLSRSSESCSQICATSGWPKAFSTNFSFARATCKTTVPFSKLPQTRWVVCLNWRGKHE